MTSPTLVRSGLKVPLILAMSAVLAIGLTAGVGAATPDNAIHALREQVHKGRPDQPELHRPEQLQVERVI